MAVIFAVLRKLLMGSLQGKLVFMEAFVPFVACLGARLLAGPWLGLAWLGLASWGWGGGLGPAACLLACLLACLPSEASINLMSLQHTLMRI